MVDRWYISDHHLDHYNILRYGKRPFKDLTEMHDQLLERHNQIVKPQDHVSFLGDVTMKRGGRLDREWFIREIRRYHGHKRLYLGNHDHMAPQVYLDAGFEKIYATWRTDEGFVCSHIPLHPNSLSNAIANVHGHIHQNSSYPVIKVCKDSTDRRYPERMVPYINVSVEAIDYRPIHLDEILQKVKDCNA